VWSGMEWRGMAHYCFCVDLLVVDFANIDRVVSDESVVMNSNLGRICVMMLSTCHHFDVLTYISSVPSWRKVT
jgi:hypothetical protein